MRACISQKKRRRAYAACAIAAGILCAPLLFCGGTRAAVRDAAAVGAKTVNFLKPLSREPLKISFIDVGFGDSILIYRNGHAMLIDAGTENAVPVIEGFLRSKKVTALDLLIATHPHEDHICGMDSIIRDFKVKKLLMPDVSITSDCFYELLAAAKDKNLTIEKPKPNDTYRFEGAKLTIFAPNGVRYDELNDYSLVMRLTYGSTSFLLAGDAQKVSEAQMLAKGYPLKSDVLKLGHHGLDTSTSQAFLNAVSPRYAVITKADPGDAAVMKRLKDAKVRVYRTGRDGTITAATDGKTILFSTANVQKKPKT